MEEEGGDVETVTMVEGVVVGGDVAAEEEVEAEEEEIRKRRTVQLIVEVGQTVQFPSPRIHI